MKRIFFGAIVLALAASSAQAQTPSWTEVESGTGNRLKDIVFLDGDHGFTVGHDATILRTFDGGRVWSAVANPAAMRGSDLHGVFFLDSNIGFVAGDNATLLRTDDGGSSWSFLSFPDISAASQLRTAFFLDTDIGFVIGWDKSAGGVIMHTTDGGRSWSVFRPMTSSMQAATNVVFNMTFVDDQTGFAVGEKRTILRTTNGGQTWSWTHAFLPSSVLFFDVFFSDAQTGFVVGGSPGGPGYILRTTNGGDSWSVVHQTNTEMRSVVFPDISEGFVAGDEGIFRTTDGGTTWNEHLSSPTPLHSVYFKEGQTGFAVGVGGTMYQLIRVGTASGEQETPSTARLYQNYPNPFNSSTSISYRISQTSEVTLTIFDILGRAVSKFASGPKPPGTYEWSFDSASVPSGMYMYRLQAGDVAETKMMMVAK